MKLEPEQLSLKDIYEYLIETIFGRRHYKDLEPFIASDLWLFGTAEHERISSLDQFKQLIKKQNEELKEITLNFQRPNSAKIQSLGGGTVQVITEEIPVQIVEVNGSFIFRLTTVWENIKNQWLLINAHSSTPDSNIDKKEAWPVEGIIKKNRELEAKIDQRTEELRISLETLKSTQAQLIQSEKMASLGELTAGIAHEIQNPLNFINNFSEINGELLLELTEEIENGNYEEVKTISNDIVENEKKIAIHGKRADGIVKSMLQHSRASSGVREITDINALGDEYLRLSYHGMRARDQSFSAELKTRLDPGLPRIEVVPQDIGRVLLNILNNAFQAVQNVENPEVSVSTKLLDDQIEILISDNGPGIPDEIKDKIFQPFFTTKPTGQGTGLGLSLAYDIIKAHGGELKVGSEEGQGSEFIIILPR